MGTSSVKTRKRNSRREIKFFPVGDGGGVPTCSKCGEIITPCPEIAGAINLQQNLKIANVPCVNCLAIETQRIADGGRPRKEGDDDFYGTAMYNAWQGFIPEVVLGRNKLFRLNMAV